MVNDIVREKHGFQHFCLSHLTKENKVDYCVAHTSCEQMPGIVIQEAAKRHVGGVLYSLRAL